MGQGDSHLLAHGQRTTACGKRLQLGTPPADPMQVLSEVDCEDCRALAAAEYDTRALRKIRALGPVERDRLLLGLAKILWPGGNGNAEPSGADVLDQAGALLAAVSPEVVLCRQAVRT